MLAQHFGIRRETVQHNFAALERLFLIRTLLVWHTNAARRLVKAPKVHVVDSGLASTLVGLRAAVAKRVFAVPLAELWTK